MTARNALASDFIAQLPAGTRKRLRVEDLHEVTGAVLVKDRIQQFFARVASEEGRLRKWKLTQGYCAGRPQCLAFVGKDADPQTCEACRLDMSRSHRGEARPNKHSAYGMVRAKERAAERQDREAAKARKGRAS